MGYARLNAKVPPLVPVVSKIIAITKAMATHKGYWYTVTDVANAFLSTPLHDEDEDQYEFIWNGLWHDFIVFPKGNFNSPAICHQWV